MGFWENILKEFSFVPQPTGSVESVLGTVILSAAKDLLTLRSKD